MALAPSRLGACLFAWLAFAAGGAQAAAAASRDRTTERCLALGPSLLQVDQRRSLTPSAGEGDGFEPVDGGADRACRGHDASDRQNGYMSVLPLTPDLEACKARCRETYGCRGVEWGSAHQRCEVWTRPQGIAATAKVPGYTCLRYTPSVRFEWSPADGGDGRACRGRDANDNWPSYWRLHEGVNSLEECKEKCVGTIGCKGVEYSPSVWHPESRTRRRRRSGKLIPGYWTNGGRNRCEVWVRALGIGATMEKTGYTCLRYGPGATPVPARHVGEVELKLCERTPREQPTYAEKYVHHAGSTDRFDLSFPSNPVALSYTVHGGGSGPGSTLKLSVEIDGGWPSSIAIRASGSDGLCLQSISVDGVQAQGMFPMFLDNPCIPGECEFHCETGECADAPKPACWHRDYVGIPCSTTAVWQLPAQAGR